jgi:2,5-furandicarboxylate decarboxylase 1
LQEKYPHELLHVDKTVDPKFELSAVLRKLQEEAKYPTVIFEHVKSSRFPVISNVIGRPENLSLALETTGDHVLDAYAKGEDHPIKPKLVARGPVKDTIVRGSEVDFAKLPIITNCEKDAGPYITAGITLVKDPKTGIRDTGIFKLGIRGKNRAIISMEDHARANYFRRKAEKAGKPLDTAIIIGHHPAVALGSQTKVPPDVDDLEVIGGLLGEPLEIVKAETIDLEVPAYAEIVVEGKILPNVRDVHGAFGDFAWYYADPEDEVYVFEASAITYRKDAFYQHIFAAHREHNLHGKISREVVLRKRIQAMVPTLKKVNLPLSGLCRFTAYVSIRKEFDGAGRLAALAALASDPFVKLVVVVDEDINVEDEAEVLWAIATRVQADNAVFMVPEVAGSIIDPSSYSIKSRVEKGHLVTKWAIDATKPVSVPFAERADVPKIMWEKTNLKQYIREYAEK